MKMAARSATTLRLAVVAALGLTVSTSARAQQVPTTIQETLVGTWSVVSQYVEHDGKRLEPFGADPKGLLVYDRTGHFVFVLQRAHLPNFASNNRLTGTPDENQAIVTGSIAYFGRYSVNEREGKLHLHYDGSTYANWDGTDQVRSVKMAGDELEITSAASTVGGGTVHLVVRRLR